MSLQLNKIVQIYEQSIAMLQAKNQLLISQQPKISTEYLSFNKNNKTSSEVWTVYIDKSLQKILNIWITKYFMFEQFQSTNNACIRQLSSKMLQIKNNSSILSKQGLLLADIQTQIKNWNQVTEPLVYYDIKKRQSFKNEIKQKMSQVKQNTPLTKQSQSPVYMKKLEQQLKRTIFSVYLSQVSISKGIRDINYESWQGINKFIYCEDKQIRNLKLFNYISEMKSHFFQNFGESLLNKKLKMNQNFFQNYFKQICALFKNISRFWNDYNKSITQILDRINKYCKMIEEYKQDFSKRENKIIKLLEKPIEAVNKIFNIQASMKGAICLSQIFQILSVLKRFRNALQGLRTITTKNYKQSQEYSNVVISQYQPRRKDPYFYTIDDKTFIDANSKNQYIFNKKIIQIYCKFLSQCYDIAKNSTQIFKRQYLLAYEAHQIASMLSKQIVASDLQNPPNLKFSKSQFSTNSSDSSMKNKPKIKNEQLLEIQKFQNQIYVFDSSGINWNRNNIFSCALGPRLLLQGTIAILQEGIYFQSFFNKKNLFFGRTRLFVPRTQIIQISNYNTIVIFPNAIEVKTKVGSLYFYSMSNKITIQNTLNQVYFPQNSPNADEAHSQADFKEQKESPPSKYTQKQISQLLKPNQNVIVDKIFKDTKLNKFFKRYFSDDEFQIRGQKYENFRTYFLMQIEAIDPKCTPLIPDPPSYFFYKNEPQKQKNFPKTSERLHTYKKIIPNIPFLSSGGEGLCQDKQTYYWITPRILVINIVSKVKGFSLIEAMQIDAKTVLVQQDNNLHFTLTTGVRFLTESSTNKLVKGPAISNLKDTIIKMLQIIQKYEKGKRNRSSRGKQNQKNQQNQSYQQNITKLLNENKKLKLRFNITIIAFAVIYLFTILFFTVL